MNLTKEEKEAVIEEESESLACSSDSLKTSSVMSASEEEKLTAKNSKKRTTSLSEESSVDSFTAGKNWSTAKDGGVLLEKKAESNSIKKSYPPLKRDAESSFSLKKRTTLEITDSKGQINAASEEIKKDRKQSIFRAPIVIQSLKGSSDEGSLKREKVEKAGLNT